MSFFCFRILLNICKKKIKEGRMQTDSKRFFISFQLTAGMVTMVNLLFTMVILLQVKYYSKMLFKLSMNMHFYIQSKIFNILDFYDLWTILLNRCSFVDHCLLCFIFSIIFIPSEKSVLNCKF